MGGLIRNLKDKIFHSRESLEQELKGRDPAVCDLCGKEEAEVTAMFNMPKGSACDRCVSACIQGLMKMFYSKLSKTAPVGGEYWNAKKEKAD